MSHEITFAVEIPEEPEAWVVQETKVRGARRAFLLRHPGGTDVLLKRTNQGAWIAALGRPGMAGHPDGGAAIHKTFYDDVVLPEGIAVQRGEAPVAPALRLLAARHGGRARRLVAFLRVCARLHALAHLAEVSHVSQETARDGRTVVLRLHAVRRHALLLPLPDDVGAALGRALWSAHSGRTPLATNLWTPIPESAHARLALRQALLAEAEELIDPDLAGARPLLVQASETQP